ncbi:MAG TPA: alpha/beta hydrolase [Thermoleophilaceae bacterium]|nr:alpha/beta hydrolase [Thermoleophilaceae bacterium]
MPELELTAGTIDYEDSGGDGPVLVFQHGVAMGGSEWREVVADLRDDHRCVVPELPLGAHRRPMRPEADLSFDGLTGVVLEVLDRLDLADATLVGSDSGLAQLVAARQPERLGRLVLTSCEAFDNVPPGLPGRNLGRVGRLPGGINAMIQPLRLRPLRRLPIAFGWMSKRLTHERSDEWLEPLLTERGVRRDLAKFIRTSDMRALEHASERLREFDRPALVVWAKEDRVMPPEHGRRLAELLPQGRLVEVDDSYTLIPIDQPAVLAGAIREFVRETAPAPAGAVR